MKPNGRALKIVLLASYTYTMMLTTLVMPIMGDIAQAFPNAGSKISLLISLPALVMIPAIMAGGYLSKIISKKTVLIAGSLMFIIGGAAGGLIDNINFILFMRAVAGFGTGLIFPIVPALIAELFDEGAVPQMIGWGNAAGSITAMIFSAVTGYVALRDWHYPFYIYLIYLILLAAQIMVLPKVEPERRSAGDKDAVKPRLNWLACGCVLIGLAYMVISMVYILQTAIFIMSENIGNSSQTGIASSVTTLTAFAVSLFFGQVFNILKRYTAFVGFVALGICFFLFSIAHSFSIVLVASVFMGISLATVLSYIMTMVTRVAPPGAQTMGITYVSTAMFVGQFLSAYYMELVLNLAGGSIRTMFMLIFGNVAICLVIGAVFIGATKRKMTVYYQPQEDAM